MKFFYEKVAKFQGIYSNAKEQALAPFINDEDAHEKMLLKVKLQYICKIYN